MQLNSIFEMEYAYFAYQSLRCINTVYFAVSLRVRNILQYK